MLSNSLRAILVIISIISPSMEVPKDKLSSLADTEDMIIESHNRYIDPNSVKDEQNSRPLTDKDFENGRKLTEEQLIKMHDKINHDKQLNDKNLFEGDIIIQSNSQPVSFKSFFNLIYRISRRIFPLLN